MLGAGAWCLRKGTTLQTTVRPLHCGTAAAGSDCGRRNRSQARSTSTAAWTRRPSSWNLVPLNVCRQVDSRGRLSDLSAARVTAAKPPARKIVGGGSSGGDVSTGIAPMPVGMFSSRRSMPRLYRDPLSGSTSISMSGCNCVRDHICLMSSTTLALPRCTPLGVIHAELKSKSGVAVLLQFSHLRPTAPT